eukprot:1369578-Prymnesium_polylepis.1
MVSWLSKPPIPGRWSTWTCAAARPYLARADVWSIPHPSRTYVSRFTPNSTSHRSRIKIHTIPQFHARWTGPGVRGRGARAHPSSADSDRRCPQRCGLWWTDRAKRYEAARLPETVRVRCRRRRRTHERLQLACPVSSVGCPRSTPRCVSRSLVCRATIRVRESLHNYVGFGIACGHGGRQARVLILVEDALQGVVIEEGEPQGAAQAHAHTPPPLSASPGGGATRSLSPARPSADVDIDLVARTSHDRPGRSVLRSFTISRPRVAAQAGLAAPSQQWAQGHSCTFAAAAPHLRGARRTATTRGSPSSQAEPGGADEARAAAGRGVASRDWSAHSRELCRRGSDAKDH